MYIYRRVRDLREDSDRTQEEIAEKLNTYKTTYRRWESGETEIPTHIIIELSKIYGTTTDYILGLTDEPRGRTGSKASVYPLGILL